MMTSFASRDHGSPSPPLHEKRVIRLTAFSLSSFLSPCVCLGAFCEKQAFLTVIFVNYVMRIISQIRNRVHVNIRRLRSFNSRRRKKRAFSQDRVLSIPSLDTANLRIQCPQDSMTKYQISIPRFVSYSLLLMPSFNRETRYFDLT